MSIFNEKTAILIRKWPNFSHLLLIEQFIDLLGLALNFEKFIDLPGLDLKFWRNCLLNNFREIRIRNLKISGSKIFVKFWWPVLIENWTGFHRFKRSCYLPCLTNNSRFLMNADVFKNFRLKNLKFWKIFGKFGNFRGGLN